MNYPLISEYIEAIKAAEDNFKELTNLRPVHGDDGLPVMTSGNFAVVFKMEDTVTGKFYALKCFTKEQEGRAEAYHQITDALKDVDSPYLVSLRYLDKELFVDTEQTSETEFPVLLMDWVDGKTLDKYLRENLDDKYALEMLAYRFSQLAQWLIPQPFAHGDLKPDNILVREDGTLVLVDYDGMYVPAMKGQKARELGSPDFRHPLRTENDFDEHIDIFSLISVFFSLKLIAFDNSFFSVYGQKEGLLFSERDYLDISTCSLLRQVFPSKNTNLNRIYSTFILTLSDYSLSKQLPKTDWCHFILGSADYYYELGNKYITGINGKQNTEMAFAYYEKAAELGLGKAQNKLGCFYRDGFWVKRNYDNAILWYEKAIAQGDIKAYYNLAHLGERIFDYDVNDVYNDICEKAQMFINERDDDNAYLVLGICKLIGQGTEKDVRRGGELLKIAAQKENANAQVKLGICYYGGLLGPSKKEDAVYWFRKSAYWGDPEGQFWFGMCNMNALGIEKDLSQGILWIIRSANQGWAESQSFLGECYLKGVGVEKDYNLAYNWIYKSVQKEDSSGMYLLGLCYEHGYGTISNRDKARYWYHKSAQNGNSDAQKAVERFKTEDLPL